jgi:hypothetical protein
VHLVDLQSVDVQQEKLALDAGSADKLRQGNAQHAGATDCAAA